MVTCGDDLYVAIHLEVENGGSRVPGAQRSPANDFDGNNWAAYEIHACESALEK